jgi:hypothetical protein
MKAAEAVGHACPQLHRMAAMSCVRVEKVEDVVADALELP